MKNLIWILVLGMAASACAQQPTRTDEQDLREQITVAEQNLERLKLSYVEFFPGVIQAERAIWDLERQLPLGARSSALQARLDAAQQHLESLLASGLTEEDPAVRTSRDRLEDLNELLTESN